MQCESLQLSGVSHQLMAAASSACWHQLGSGGGVFGMWRHHLGGSSAAAAIMAAYKHRWRLAATQQRSARPQISQCRDALLMAWRRGQPYRP